LQDLIDRFAPDCTIHSLGTPTLAELAEQKFRGHSVNVADAIAPLFAQAGAEKIDAIALGCTHYTFLLPEFQMLYPSIAWFDPALPVARQTLAVTRNFSASVTSASAAYFTAHPYDIEIMQEKLLAFEFTKIIWSFWPPGS
jgi:glutamate racemase